MNHSSAKSRISGAAILLCLGIAGSQVWLDRRVPSIARTPKQVARPVEAIVPSANAARDTSDRRLDDSAETDAPDPQETASQPVASTATVSEGPDAVDDLMDGAVQSRRLAEKVADAARPALREAVKIAGELARARRTIAQDGKARVYDFAEDAVVAERLRSRVIATVSRQTPRGDAAELTEVLAQAGESSPAFDMLAHRRRIVVQPTEDDSGWMILDCTYTAGGTELGANTIVLSVDASGNLFWPEEFVEWLLE